MLQVFELMNQGKINGYLAQGFNPLAAAPNKAKMTAALAKLKFLVIMDPLVTETSEFWRNYGELNDVDSSQDPDRSVSPADHLLRRGRRLRWSTPSRWLQWHWKARRAARRGAHRHRASWPGCSLRLRGDVRRAKAAAFPDPIVNLSWPYAHAHEPTPEELAKEYHGQALADLTDPKDPTKVLRARRASSSPASRELTRRRQHRERLLDFLRRLEVRPAT